MPRADQPTHAIWIPAEPDATAQQIVQDAIPDDDVHRHRAADVTCQICIIANDDEWIVQTYTATGDLKTATDIDEIYITYREGGPIPKSDDPRFQEGPTAVAVLLPQPNGHYRLRWHTPPMHANPDTLQRPFESSTLTVHFEYTNGLGRLAPPSKNRWINGAYTHTQYTVPCPCRPPTIHTFEPLSQPNLSAFAQVIAFGDSTFDQFVRVRPNNKYLYRPNLAPFVDKLRMPLNDTTVPQFLQELARQHGERLLVPNTALVVGSALWDLLSSKTHDDAHHIAACRMFVTQIKQQYPDVTLVWKLPMAVHIHWVDLERLASTAAGHATLFGLDRVRYMSRSRSRSLHDKQLALMRELDIATIDAYLATHLSSYKLYPSDGRHYRPEFNKMILNWCYATAGEDNG